MTHRKNIPVDSASAFAVMSQLLVRLQAHDYALAYVPYVHTSLLLATVTDHNTLRKYLLTWGDYIEEVLKLIHPDLCQPPVVLVDDVSRPAGEGVRCCLSENVANVGAGDNLEGAAALPNLRPNQAVSADRKERNHRGHSRRDRQTGERAPPD